MDSHPFMSIHPLFPMIELFKYLTFKIQGQSHSLRSLNRYNILSTHIPFIPCWSAFPFLRCSYLKNWPWKSKVKVMGEVKVKNHNVNLTSYRLTSLSFHGNLASHCWVTTFSKLTLKIKGQGHGWGHSLKSQCGCLTSYRFTSLLFYVNRASHSWVMTYSKFDLENQGSKTWVRSQFKVTMWV